jgi:hypothetical protein
MQVDSEMKGTPGIEMFERADQIEALRQANQRLSTQLIQAKNRGAEIVSAVYQGAYDATLVVGRVKSIPAKEDKRTKSAEVALWHMTDWQGAKLTTSYNSEVMKERVKRFVQKAISITDIQRADHPVKDCVIMFGGDMVEGLFNFPTQPFEVDATLFGQFVTVARLIEEVVLEALANYEHVTVVSEWGNHGRLGSKRDAIPKSDNLDRMTYELARQRLSDEPRLAWNDSAEDIQRVEIGSYRALLMHGDEVGRSGFAAPAAWQAAGNRWKAGAYEWDFQDIFLGHFHKTAQENLSDGIGFVYWTGSTESGNRYARDSMAASGVPSQRLHFVDPEKGRTTAQYIVYVDK